MGYLMKNKPNLKNTVAMPYIFKGQEVLLVIGKVEDPDAEDGLTTKLPLWLVPKDGEELPPHDTNDLMFIITNILWGSLYELGKTADKFLEHE